MARHRLRWPQSRVLMLVVAVAAVVFLAGSVLWAQLGQQAAQEQTGQVAQQRDEAAAQAQSLAEQIKDECATGELTGPVCQQAEQVAGQPIPREGPRGPGPTPEQIRAAVETYLVEHPPAQGRPPTTAEVAAAVAEYMIEHPPEPGRPPTAEEIASTVEVYFATNPPPEGPRGERGPAPTAEEIRAVVDAYFAEHPPPAGKTGPQGAQGVGVEDVRPELRDGECVLVFELYDPATDTRSERAVPVEGLMCPAPGGGEDDEGAVEETGTPDAPPTN